MIGEAEWGAGGLGAVPARTGGPAGRRPSAAPATAEGARLPAGLTLWSWQHHEDRWQFRSAAHDYLPFPGVAAVRSGAQLNTAS